jgi:hypothetical protein
VPAYLPFVLIGLVAVALLASKLAHQRRTTRAQRAALEQLGFRPCPDETGRLEAIVAGIACNRGFRYEVREPKRLPGEPAVYHYLKFCHRDAGDDAPVEAEEEILFPLARGSTSGLVLVVKPSSIAPGLATRLLGALASAPWDVQPDDLQRLEIPRDLENTNLIAALGPPGARLYDLVDARTVGVVLGLGDAGGMFVRFRDAWCVVSSASAQVPFRLDQLVARIRSLL